MSYLNISVFWDSSDGKPFVKESVSVNGEVILYEIISKEVEQKKPAIVFSELVIKSAESSTGYNATSILHLPSSQFMELIANENLKELIVVISKPTPAGATSTNEPDTFEMNSPSVEDRNANNQFVNLINFGTAFVKIVDFIGYSSYISIGLISKNFRESYLQQVAHKKIDGKKTSIFFAPKIYYDQIIQRLRRPHTTDNFNSDLYNILTNLDTEKKDKFAQNVLLFNMKHVVQFIWYIKIHDSGSLLYWFLKHLIQAEDGKMTNNMFSEIKKLWNYQRIIFDDEFMFPHLYPSCDLCNTAILNNNLKMLKFLHGKGLKHNFRRKMWKKIDTSRKQSTKCIINYLLREENKKKQLSK